MRIGGHEIEISHREKVFFPESGLTKGDVVDYYARMAEVMLPHLRRYPLSMHRFPDGIEAGGFYAKDAPDHFPDWLRRVRFPRRDDGAFAAPVADSRAALVYLADQAVLTPHLYLARCDDLEHPDRLVFDLDPPAEEGSFAAVRRAALELRRVLADLDLPAWVQTTGSSGLHVVVPIDRAADFEAARRFARGVARLTLRRDPDAYTLEQRKHQRRGRLFLDVLRNAYGATAVAPYALRPLPGAPVATPVVWEEVEDDSLGPRDWTLESVPRRLEQRDDPWAGMMRHARALTRRRDRLEELLAGSEPAPEEVD